MKKVSLVPKVIKQSAMRFSLVVTTIGVFVVLMSVSFYIVMQTLDKTQPEWASMSVFFGGVAAVITGVGWNKTKQKEIEINEKE